MQSPPVPRYLVPPRSKYSPQHHVLKHPQLVLPFIKVSEWKDTLQYNDQSVCCDSVSLTDHDTVFIYPFLSQYILLLLLFVVKNKNPFTTNSENHTKSTRQFSDFYQPLTNFTVYQRGVHYMGIRIFSNLPPYI